MSDSQALAWLERLRTASAEQRTRELQELLRLNPEMHGQVVQLLTCAERTRECGVPMQAMRDSTEPPRVCVPLALGVGESVAGYRLLRATGPTTALLGLEWDRALNRRTLVAPSLNVLIGEVGGIAALATVAVSIGAGAVR